MKQINTLWPERLQSFYKEVQRYLKYLFNDHFRIVLIFGGGAAIYYYSQWVNTLSPKFPVALVLATLLALFLTFSPYHYFIKRSGYRLFVAFRRKVINLF